MDNPQERLVSKDFVAGLIVGEGWFGLTVQKTPRLKMKHGFTIRPRFALQMNDVETMKIVARSLESWGLAFHVDSKPKKGMRIDIAGCKRADRLIDAILPHLWGAKCTAASLVKEFIDLRFSKPQNAPYGEDEFRIVEDLRAVNSQRVAVIATGELRDMQSLKRRYSGYERPESSETTRRTPA